MFFYVPSSMYNFPCSSLQSDISNATNTSEWHGLVMLCRIMGVMIHTHCQQKSRRVSRLPTSIIHSFIDNSAMHILYKLVSSFTIFVGWVGLWGFLWWAPSAQRKDHHGVSSGWSSVWHRSNTGLSSTQYEQIPIILGVRPFRLTPFFFLSITFWRADG